MKEQKQNIEPMATLKGFPIRPGTFDVLGATALP